mgnify:CR=1 FL=1
MLQKRSFRQQRSRSIRSLFIIFAIGLSCTTWAQEDIPQDTIEYHYTDKLQWELTAALNASGISGNEFRGINKAGIFGSVSVLKSLNPDWTWRASIAFSNKGELKNPDPENSDFTRYKLGMNYIEMPVMIRWNRLRRFGVELGLSLGYLLNYTEEDFQGTITIARPFEPIEFAGIVGFYVPLDEHFSAAIRFSNSIWRVRRHNQGSVFWPNFGQLNSVINFSISYRGAFSKEEDK